MKYRFRLRVHIRICIYIHKILYNLCIRFNARFAGFKLECEEERAKGRHDAADVRLMMSLLTFW